MATITAIHADNSHDRITVMEECYLIKHHGITLDIIPERAKAIKHFICDYKPHGKHYSIHMLRNGTQMQIHPSGSISDYIPIKHAA